MSSGKQTRAKQKGRQLNPERLICRISCMMVIYGTAGKRHHRVWIPSKLCFQAGFSPRIMRVKLQHKGRASANMEPNRTRLCFYWEPSSGNSGTTGVSAETGAALEGKTRDNRRGEHCGVEICSHPCVSSPPGLKTPSFLLPNQKVTRPAHLQRAGAMLRSLYSHNRKKPAACA